MRAVAAADRPSPDLAGALERGGHRILLGTCSWTDRTLVQEADWYPRRAMSPEERLRFYASRFPLVEADATYYRPLTADLARTWAERTPPGFRMNIKAWSLHTGQPTRPPALWADLRERLPPAVRDKRSIYAHHLPADVLDETWRRFDEALEPLRAAGRLGAVLMQYPPWFGPRRETVRELEALPERLPGTRVCVEFRSPRWLADLEDRERTLGRLERLGLALVCVDAPAGSGLGRLLAATRDDLAVVRFHGRDSAAWARTGRSAAERFRYRYADAELEELVDPLLALAGDVAETHLLMNTCHRDDGVRNAARLRELLAARIARR
ncbi:MAG TPA: DUF72 domain-containing protein [Baekduia sp.]|nr:DUF72 domain-containing protein [Baekduia sp.]